MTDRVTITINLPVPSTAVQRFDELHEYVKEQMKLGNNLESFAVAALADDVLMAIKARNQRSCE